MSRNTPPWTSPWWSRALGFGFTIVCFCILGGVASLWWLAFLDPVTPLQSHRLVRVEVRGGAAPYLLTTREFCFSRASEAEAGRTFRRLPDGPDDQEEVAEIGPQRVHLDAGCYTRGRRVDVPEDFRAGRWRYFVSLRWCNGIGNCRTEWLPPVAFEVGGGPGRFTLTLDEAR